MEEKKDKTAEDAKDEVLRSTKDDLRDFKNEFWSEMSALKGEQYDVSEEHVFSEAAAPVDEATVEPQLTEASEAYVAEPAIEETIAHDEPVDAATGQSEALPEESGQGCDALFDFFDTVDRARFGEYDSYLKLGEVAGSDSVFSEFARRNITSLNAYLLSDYIELPTILSITGVVSDKRTVNFEKAPARDLFDIVNMVDIPHETRRFSARFITEKPQKEILEGAHKTLGESNSLYALAAICGILKEKFGRKADFMDLDGWKTYCEQRLKHAGENKKGNK